MQLFVFTSEFYKRFDGAVSISVVLKESENKVEGLSPRLRVRVPVKPFFIFFIFCVRKEAGNFSRFTCLQKKKHVLMYYAHVKRL